ncbi:MAG: phospho-N-acetylmuramoyl-pentapeptide-transferase [Candidatus Glassbacteria bacterium RIFCSPLOWO2_12_FULL_58_11]|uniref:Phospho-N-acetylmuramoyl-pentapeptide-transferase n=2 Tax=Candidatus Glassiibacteriota TaxID=1817805 RepID=A0A1F5YM95_9BACT|nr:MAG: phospho-N-acetylmuramoyl-pentapeptide-transferase [Candidatus Glassbacteria bacterium GWA2_58_10]OGG01087.1 MAG: phospho-N-acetylmuramoyl-pentapeptide-transferase [Candidatus Glassbacteria bacterium RIFCSPLOWO2_12_FULL_58_11]
MIYYLCKYVLEPVRGFDWTRLASYISFRSILAAMTAFLLILLLGNRMIRYLYLHGAKDTLHDYGFMDPESKRGTPTMGGTLIVGAVLLAIFLWSDPANPFVQWVVAAMIWFGGIGFYDDYLKVKHKDSQMGLSQVTKLGLQTVFAIVFMIFYLNDYTSPLSAERIRLLQDAGAVTPENYKFFLQVPFYKFPVLDLSWFYLPFGVFVILAISNSVNFADGLDGLAIVPASLTAGVYGLFSYIIGNSIYSKTLLFTHIIGSGELSIILAALVGAGMGFLWFNAFPAQVFMGDTGSMALGGVLAVVSIMLKHEFLFLLAGGIFVAEGASVLIQEKIGIGLLGRRIFHRAPIHHNYQHFGIAETKVVVRFWIVGIILMLLSLATIKIR